MWLKRFSAVLAILLVIFSVSLVPAYGDVTSVEDASDLYLYCQIPSYDALTQTAAYPVPHNKIEICKTVGPGDGPVEFHFGVKSSVYKPLTTSGVRPTLYYGYAVVSGEGVTPPSYIAGVSSVDGTAYNDKGAKAGTITQTLVSQMAGGSSHTRLAICRITLPHNTAFFEVPITDSSPGFTLYPRSNGIGFAFAYILNTDDDKILSYLDQILTHCANMDTDLDTVIELLRAVTQYLNNLALTTDDIAQNVHGIYDLLKNSLAAESAAVSQNAQQVGDTIMMQTDGEDYWKDKNTENFNSLDIGNFSFDNGLMNALKAVGKWFSNIWESLGPVTIIFTFPLTLGIALVVVGRVARSAGKGSKTGKGGSDDG